MSKIYIPREKRRQIAKKIFWLWIVGAFGLLYFATGYLFATALKTILIALKYRTLSPETQLTLSLMALITIGIEKLMVLFVIPFFDAIGSFADAAVQIVIGKEEVVKVAKP